MLASGRILRILRKMHVILHDFAEIGFPPEPGTNIDARCSDHVRFLTHVFVKYADPGCFCNTSRPRSGIRAWAAQISLLARALQCPHPKIHIFAKKSARNPLPRRNGRRAGPWSHPCRRAPRGLQRRRPTRNRSRGPHISRICFRFVRPEIFGLFRRGKRETRSVGTIPPGPPLLRSYLLGMSLFDTPCRQRTKFECRGGSSWASPIPPRL